MTYEIDRITHIERLTAEIQKMDVDKRMKMLATEEHCDYKQAFYDMIDSGLLILTREEIDTAFGAVEIQERTELKKLQDEIEQKKGNIVALCTVIIIAACLFFIYFLPK